MRRTPENILNNIRARIDTAGLVTEVDNDKIIFRFSHIYSIIQFSQSDSDSDTDSDIGIDAYSETDSIRDKLIKCFQKELPTLRKKDILSICTEQEHAQAEIGLQFIFKRQELLQLIDKVDKKSKKMDQEEKKQAHIRKPIDVRALPKNLQPIITQAQNCGFLAFQSTKGILELLITDPTKDQEETADTDTLIDCCQKIFPNIDTKILGKCIKRLEYTSGGETKKTYLVLSERRLLTLIEKAKAKKKTINHHTIFKKQAKDIVKENKALAANTPVQAKELVDKIISELKKCGHNCGKPTHNKHSGWIAIFFTGKTHKLNPSSLQKILSGLISSPFFASKDNFGLAINKGRPSCITLKTDELLKHSINSQVNSYSSSDEWSESDDEDTGSELGIG